MIISRVLLLRSKSADPKGPAVFFGLRIYQLAKSNLEVTRGREHPIPIHSQFRKRETRHFRNRSMPLLLWPAKQLEGAGFLNAQFSFVSSHTPFPYRNPDTPHRFRSQ